MGRTLQLTAAGLMSLALLAAPPTYAQEEEEAAAAPDAEEAAQEHLDDEICRRIRVTGSRIRQRICMSRGSRNRMREHSQRQLEDSDGDADMVTSRETPTAAGAPEPSGRR